MYVSMCIFMYLCIYNVVDRNISITLFQLRRSSTTEEQRIAAATSLLQEENERLRARCEVLLADVFSCFNVDGQ